MNKIRILIMSATVFALCGCAEFGALNSADLNIEDETGLSLAASVEGLDPAPLSDEQEYEVAQSMNATFAEDHSSLTGESALAQVTQTPSAVGVSASTPLDKIRALSRKYFGQISQNTPVVQMQLNFLKAGGTLLQLEKYFAVVWTTWRSVTGKPPPAYAWVDIGMQFLLTGGTADNYRRAVVQAVTPPKNDPFRMYVPAIRALSINYFGRASSNDLAVARQVEFIHRGGGSLSRLATHFANVRNSWVAVTGRPPPAYSWVDYGMDYFVAGGNVAEYKRRIRQAKAAGQF